MRAASALLVAALASGCVPLAPQVAFEAETWIVVVIDDGVVASAHHVPSGERLVISQDAGRTLYYLAYDRSLAELAVEASDDGTIALAPPGSTAQDSWPLPPPTRWASVAGLEGSLREGTDPAEAIAALADARARLPRGPCPTVRVEPQKLGFRLETSMLLPLGDGALLGTTRRYGRREDGSPRLLYVEYGQPAITLAAPFVHDAAVISVLDPEGYIEDGRAWVMWGDPGAGPEPEVVLRSIARTATGGFEIGPPAPVLRAADPPPLRPYALLSRTLATGEPLRLALTSSGTLERFDPTTGAWQVLRRDRSLSAVCRDEPRVTLLDMIDDRRGIAGFHGTELIAFDVSANPPLFEPYSPQLTGDYCRTARAVFASGDELVSTKGSNDIVAGADDDVLWWRAPGVSAFTRVPAAGGLEVNGAAIATLGDVAFVTLKTLSVPAATVAMFERDGRRPDQPPRYCSDHVLDIDMRYLLRIGDRVLGTGSGAGGIVWLSVEPPAPE